MTLKSISVTCVTLCSLSACNLYGDPTSSGFRTPTSSGFLSETNRNRAGSDFSGVTGNGYGYELGTVSKDGFHAYSGIVPGASVSAQPATGSASYTGRYEVAIISGVTTNGAMAQGFTSIDTGALRLTADFDAGTLSGDSTSGRNALSMNGTFDGTALTGTARYNGVSGPLSGLVGGNEVIGAFHGHDDSQAHAGGFIAN